jgi:MFS family permease
MGSRYKWYVVGMLWCISFFNYADRQAIFSVFPLLEKEMGLTPVQLGLLGSSFAWVYGLTAPFAGSLVDRMRRTRAILGGLHIWSIICALTSLSRNFSHLVFFRAAEGLGETIYYPASMSMVSDYHGKRTRSRAMGLHQTSVYIGTIAGGFFAGLIGQHYGWRSSFVVFGTLGIVLGLFLKKYLVEPERGAADRQDAIEAGTQAAEVKKLPVRESLRVIWSTPTVLFLMAAFTCSNFVAVVLLSWMPKFLYDRFSMSLAEAGLMATLFAQISSMAGSPLGGWLADGLRRRRAAGRVMVQAIAVFAAAPFVYLCGQAGSVPVVITALVFWGLMKGFYDANIFASVFDVIPAEARGTAAGFMNLVGWLGGGTAPLAIGLMVESTGLGNAISMASAVYVMGGLLLTTAILATVGPDVARIEGRS